MSKINSVDSLIEDAASAEKQPKWVRPFRVRYYKDASLPFILIYQASGIASNPNSKLYRNKSAAIAIATDNLQKAGCLLPESNALSARGELREVATMSRLGKKKTQEYIKLFERI